MSDININIREEMLSMATEACKRAYAPYSGYRVGACLRTEEGKYYCGCNIENAAFTPTSCAERTALFTAVYEGERRFTAIAIVCSGDEPAYPCGVCRQALSEFCSGEMPVFVRSASGKEGQKTMAELLPFSFGKADLL